MAVFSKQSLVKNGDSVYRIFSIRLIQYFTDMQDIFFTITNTLLR